jgi:hypothetical protein
VAIAAASGGRVLVGAAVGHGLSDGIFSASGVSDAQRAFTDVVGMGHKPLFAKMILRSGGITDPDSLHDEIADTVVAAAGSEPATRAIVLECADMSVASEAIRQRTGLPVFDAVMLGEIA